MHYAFFAPYTLGQHLALVSEMQSFDGVRLRLLGETLDGHDIDQLQIGALGISHLVRTSVELSAARLAGHTLVSNLWAFLISGDSWLK